MSATYQVWAAKIIDRVQKLAATRAKDWGRMLVVLAIQPDGDRAQALLRPTRLWPRHSLGQVIDDLPQASTLSLRLSH